MSHELEADGADYYEHERLCRLHDEETNVERELRGEIERLERENAALKNAIALGQENCDAEYERLREERDEAIAKNAALRAALDAQMQYQRDLRADRDRLDLLASRYWAVPVTKEHTDHIWMIDHDTPDLRAAIDARAKEGGAT